ncbi:transforming growth factor-beta receptor-associated 1-like [Paramuricea clavata]|uniref:Transforming growth factor-beta receptor-associated 1-like n=1 Tax=Paramuricea clavata TaxID=317549 RepID=A0A6S7GY04_PARCT|nr:transforming growth factor-beta receptor-associated 1-like [Paramuricea clavata]
MVISGFKDKLKGATCVARNDNPASFDPFSVEVCVGTRKKVIHIVMITEDNVYPKREISLAESPVHLNFDGSTVCVALSSVYCNVDVPSGKIQELISYEPQNTRPIITRIAVRDFQNNEKTMEHSDRWIMTGWHGEQWDFQNNEKTMEHSDHWIMTVWHGEQWDFQNNEKTMEHSDHWIMTGWHGEQWDFQNNEKTMEHSDH